MAHAQGEQCAPPTHLFPQGKRPHSAPSNACCTPRRTQAWPLAMATAHWAPSLQSLLHGLGIGHYHLTLNIIKINQYQTKHCTQAWPLASATAHRRAVAVGRGMRRRAARTQGTAALRAWAQRRGPSTERRTRWGGLQGRCGAGVRQGWFGAGGGSPCRASGGVCGGGGR